MSRTLDVYVDDALAGWLTEQNNIWAFEYAPSWLEDEHPHPLSPAIPLAEGQQVDGSTTRPVQWFFDNLLPEEQARTLLAKDVKVPVEDAFALLEVAGAESAGAITLLPHGQELEPGGTHTLAEDEIRQRIQALPKMPLNRSERKRMSLAGAQHKMLVIYRDGALLEPSGFFPSTHILKPEHTSPDEYPHTVRNEWFVMSLAKACKLDVPPVDIKHLPEPVYLVERFDRQGSYPNQHRLHMLDGCQMLNYPHGAKYHNSSADTLFRLAERCRMKIKTQLQLFGWALFNALVGNGDAHLKNLSFFVRNNHMVMTPHYDLLSTIIYEPTGKHMDAELSQPMGNAQFFGQLNQAAVLAFAEELRIPGKLAIREMERLTGTIGDQAAQLIKRVETGASYPARAGDLRMLRKIYYNGIQEGVQRLQG